MLLDADRQACRRASDGKGGGRDSGHGKEEEAEADKAVVEEKMEE
jgi:hypothetical protein